MDNDLSLLQSYARTRDPEAFSEIVVRYQGLVFSACLRVHGDASAAEDSAQECFIRLARKAASVRSSLAGWLHRCAVRVSLDARRRHAARKVREDTYSHLKDRSDDEPAWADVSPHVDKALDDLPDSVRHMVVAHFLHQRPQAQIAKELGVSPATVSRKTEKGVEQLRAALKRVGVTVPVAVLATLLVQNAARAAPKTLSVALGKMAIAGVGGAVAGGATGLAVKAAIAVAAVGIAAGSFVVLRRSGDTLTPAPAGTPVASSPAEPARLAAQEVPPAPRAPLPPGAVARLGRYDKNEADSGHTAPVTVVAFSRNGERVATAGEDRTLRMWTALAGSERWSVPGVKTGAIAFSHDDRETYCSDRGRPQTAIARDSASGTEIRAVKLADKSQRSAISRDGKTAVAFDEEAQRLYLSGPSYPGGASRASEPLAPLGPPRAAGMPDKPALVATGDAYAARWYVRPGSGSWREIGSCARAAAAITVSPDGRMVAFVHREGERPVRLWWLERTPFELIAPARPGDRIRCAEFSPKGGLLATGSWDGSVCIWDATSTLERIRFTGHTAGVSCIAFSADGRYLVSGSDDTTAVVWDLHHLGLVDAPRTGRPWRRVGLLAQCDMGNGFRLGIKRIKAETRATGRGEMSVHVEYLVFAREPDAQLAAAHIERGAARVMTDSGREGTAVPGPVWFARVGTDDGTRPASLILRTYTVPTGTEALSELSGHVTLARIPSRSGRVTWDDPDRQLGQERAAEGFTFTLGHSIKKGRERKIRIIGKIPRANQRDLWLVGNNFMRCGLRYEDGTVVWQDPIGSFNGSRCDVNCSFQESVDARPRSVEIAFATSVSREQLPFRLRNVALPELGNDIWLASDAPRGPRGPTRVESDGLVLALRKVAFQDGSGADKQLMVEIRTVRSTNPRHLAIAEDGLTDLRAVTDRGEELVAQAQGKMRFDTGFASARLAFAPPRQPADRLARLSATCPVLVGSTATVSLPVPSHSSERPTRKGPVVMESYKQTGLSIDVKVSFARGTFARDVAPAAAWKSAIAWELYDEAGTRLVCRGGEFPDPERKPISLRFTAGEKTPARLVVRYPVDYRLEMVPFVFEDVGLPRKPGTFLFERDIF
jgi:RNA polymerase sigma factor (sigma-70 family)